MLFRSPGVESLPSDEIGVPVAICYRIFHLGSAYDGQIVKYLQPSGSVSIPYLEIQRLVSELEVVEKVTTDPVAQHYLAPLLRLLRQSSVYPSCRLLCLERKNAA